MRELTLKKTKTYKNSKPTEGGIHLSLEDLFKARTKSQGILVPLLNEYLLLEGKKPSGRKTGVFHPSEISGFFCPRQWVIKERHRDELQKEDILPGLMRVFEIGHR